MKSFGFEVESYRANGIFRVVDSYSWKSGEASSSNWTITNPGDLAVVSKTIENAIRGLINIRLVFDSITGLTSTCSYNLSFFSKFLEILVAKIKALNGNAIFVVAPEAHDQQFVNCMRQIFDGTLEMKEDESGKEMKRLLRLFSLKGAPHKTQWTPFEITNHGIVVKSETEQRCMMCSRIIEDEPHYEMIDGNKLGFDSIECAQTYKKLKSIYGENFQ
jgi:KaiC/GvpD/RAD55 family RecA-like ATPase